MRINCHIYLSPIPLWAAERTLFPACLFNPQTFRCLVSGGAPWDLWRHRSPYHFFYRTRNTAVTYAHAAARAAEQCDGCAGTPRGKSLWALLRTSRCRSRLDNDARLPRHLYLRAGRAWLLFRAEKEPLGNILRACTKRNRWRAANRT